MAKKASASCEYTVEYRGWELDDDVSLTNHVAKSDWECLFLFEFQ